MIASLTSRDYPSDPPILDDVEVPDEQAAFAEFGKALGNLFDQPGNSVTISEIHVLGMVGREFAVIVAPEENPIEAYNLTIREG